MSFEKQNSAMCVRFIKMLDITLIEPNSDLSKLNYSNLSCNATKPPTDSREEKVKYLPPHLLSFPSCCSSRESTDLIFIRIVGAKYL